MSKIAVALSLAAFTLGGCAIGIGALGMDSQKTTDGSPAASAGRIDNNNYYGGTYAANFQKIQGSLAYYLLNTNTEFPPYDTWLGNTLPTHIADMGKTIDRHFFDFDWSDAYSSSAYGR